jgi:hypothetical protein
MPEDSNYIMIKLRKVCGSSSLIYAGCYGGKYQQIVFDKIM